MKDRDARLNNIKKIIRDKRIDCQEVLLEELHKEGHGVTQATLSRDLKALRVGKVSDGNKGYYYTLPGDTQFTATEKDYLQDVQRGFISYDFSHNTCVVNTQPGHANSVALAIDQINIHEILGTIAGDDTVFLVLKEGADRANVHAFFKGRIIKPKGE
ncbi:MAG: ArgR family transcriptional regulator [Spirochaetales bacterium]|nr:ArgR family transcriptional regulator [Spirochaetales bacterium]